MKRLLNESRCVVTVTVYSYLPVFLHYAVAQSCMERVILLSENLLDNCIFLVTVVKCIAVDVQSDLSSEPRSWYV